MKLLIIGTAFSAAAFLAFGSGLANAQTATETCIVTPIQYHKDKCPPGVAYGAESTTSVAEADDADDEAGDGMDPVITPSASTEPCIKTLIMHYKNRCPD